MGAGVAVIASVRGIYFLFYVFMSQQKHSMYHSKCFQEEIREYSTLSLGSIGMDHVISDLYYKGTILLKEF